MENQSNMEKYIEMEKSLSVHEKKSKFKIKLIIFCMKAFRLLTTKRFDFILSLALFIGIASFIAGFSLALTIWTTIAHFLYWITLYRYISKFFKGDLYEETTMMIQIMENILERK